MRKVSGENGKAVEGCGRRWKAVEGGGRWWKAVEGGGRLCMPVAMWVLARNLGRKGTWSSREKIAIQPA